jgi:hypothetical protein
MTNIVNVEKRAGQAEPQTTIDLGRRSHATPVAIHLWLMVVLCAAQLLSASSRMMVGDNNWHFRLARDIVERKPVWWAAVDGNRLFPDLLFSIVAVALPGGTVYGSG